MENRIVALEEQVMFLDRHVQQLDEQVRSLTDDVLKTRRELAAMHRLGEERFERLLHRLEAESGDVPDVADSDDLNDSDKG